MKKEPPDVPLSAYIEAIERMLHQITDAEKLRKIYHFILSLYY